MGLFIAVTFGVALGNILSAFILEMLFPTEE